MEKGDECFYDELLAKAGATNVRERGHVPFCAAAEPRVFYHYRCCGRGRLSTGFQEEPNKKYEF